MQIENVPAGWSTDALGSIAQIGMGQSPPGYTYNTEERGLPLINGPVEFGPRYPTKLQWTTAPTKVCMPGDILFCVRGSTTGRMNVSNDRYCIGRGVAAIRGSESISSTEFLEVCLQRLADHLLQEAKGSGSTFPSISSGRLAETKILLPPLPEQHRIAEILDTLDEAIRKTEQVIAKLQQMKQGLLHDLLTRGIDENGELRDPERHPEQFKDSPLGQMPREWEVICLADIATKIQDGTHFSPQSMHGSRRYITSKNIRPGLLDLSDCGWISDSEHRVIYRRCDVKFGDVLLTKDGANTGNAALNDLDEPFSLLSSVAFIRVDPSLGTADYLVQYLLSSEGQRRMQDLMSGNAIRRLTLVKIRQFRVPYPPLLEQRRISEVLGRHDKRTSEELKNVEKLRTLKHGLMDDLLTGRVRVSIPKEAAV